MEADLSRGLIVPDKEIPLWDLRAFGKIREKPDLVGCESHAYAKFCLMKNITTT
jgi:hypothetical protein